MGIIKYGIFILFLCSFTNCSTVSVNNNRLISLVEADQKARIADTDEPLEPGDAARRKIVFEMLANDELKKPEDKFNAALILQHTGMMYCNKKLSSISAENHFLAYQLSKAAFEGGYKKARYFVAVTYDRYLWMTTGIQKYGTQTTFEDGKEVWVPIDPKTTDDERAVYKVPSLNELLKQKPQGKTPT